MIARSIAIATIFAVAFAATARAQFTTDHYPWLGILMGDVDGGVTIEEVLPGTPAERAGLEVGDVITALAGVPTRDTSKLLEAIRQHRVGDEVDIDVRRGKRALTVTTTLVAKPDMAALRRARLVDRRAPGFSRDVVSGDGSGTLADHRGKIVVFVSWSLSCSGCMRVFGELAALQKRLGDRMVVIVAAVAPAFDVRKALEARPLPFIVVDDAMGTVRLQYDFVAQRFDPVIAVIDGQGFVREVAFHAAYAARIVSAARALAGDADADADESDAGAGR